MGEMEIMARPDENDEKYWMNYTLIYLYISFHDGKFV